MSAIPTGRAAEFADLVAPVDKQGAQVNPATEDTLAAVVTAQANLEAKIDTLLQKLQNGDTKVALYGSNVEVLHHLTDFIGNGAANGASLALNGNQDVLLNIENHVREICVFPEISFDDVAWEKAIATNVLTGTASTELLHSGRYVVQSRGAKSFRARLVYSTGYSTPVLKITATPIYPNTVPVTLPTISRSAKKPETLQPAYEEVTLAEAAFYPLWVDSDGTVWGRGNTGPTGYTLMKSTDFGATSEPVHVFSKGPAVVRRMGDNSLVVVLNTGVIERSVNDGVDWTQVFDAENPVGATISDVMGSRSYNNIMLVSQYSDKTLTGDNLHVYMSDDYGATWRSILTGDGTGTSFHFHDVCYDPYDEAIWVVAGDQYSCIYRSLDMGVSWQIFGAGGAVPTQFTQVVPLPNCVLFGTDTVSVTGWWRWERTGQRAMHYESEDEFFARLEPARYEWKTATQSVVPFYTNSYVDYGVNAKVIFGLREWSADAQRPVTIWTTTNGYEFYPIWSAGRKASAGYGVRKIVGVGNGKVVAEVEGVGTGNLLSFPLPSYS